MSREGCSQEPSADAADLTLAIEGTRWHKCRGGSVIAAARSLPTRADDGPDSLCGVTRVNLPNGGSGAPAREDLVRTLHAIYECGDIR